jgi:hypothetical protein
MFHPQIKGFSDQIGAIRVHHPKADQGNPQLGIAKSSIYYLGRFAFFRVGRSNRGNTNAGCYETKGGSHDKLSSVNTLNSHGFLLLGLRGNESDSE